MQSIVRQGLRDTLTAHDHALDIALHAIWLSAASAMVKVPAALQTQCCLPQMQALSCDALQLQCKDGCIP